MSILTGKFYAERGIDLFTRVYFLITRNEMRGGNNYFCANRVSFVSAARDRINDPDPVEGSDPVSDPDLANIVDHADGASNRVDLRRGSSAAR